MHHRFTLILIGVLSALAPLTGMASDGRLLATGGATQVEGSAGGGLVPWAVMAGYGEDGQSGGSVGLTRVELTNFSLAAAHINWAWDNRLELSLSRSRLDLGTLGSQLGVPDATLRMNTVGAKLRLTGDLIYGSLPQISAGIQHKRLRDPAIPSAVGARNDSGTDAYLAVSRLLLGAAAGHNLLLNGTVRATRANELGYLGFGGDRNDDHELQFEASAAVFLNPRTAVGLEYRQKPDNLGFAEEDDWADLFIAWFPNRDMAFTAAWTRHGRIAGFENQDGFYLSLQAGF